MKILSTAISLFLWTLIGFAQNPCDLLDNKKQSSLINEVVKSKAGEAEKIDRLLEKSEQLADNPRYLAELGILQFKLAEQEGSNQYASALESLKRAADLCDRVNPVVHYYLGVIYYSKEEYPNALKSFKRFVTYPQNDEDKDHAAKLMDVEQSIPSIEKQLKQDLRNKAVKDLPKPNKMAVVSTERSEYLPMLSPDNTRLYFTRKYTRLGRGEATPVEVEEFSMANRTNDDFGFDAGVALKHPFNQGGNYGGVTIAPNNKELYITVCIPTSGGYKNCDLYYSKYVKYRPDSSRFDFKWTDLENLGQNINSPTSWEAQPSLSPNGRTLYFTRYSKTTQETDLYFSEKDSSGNWQEAKAMESLNSTGHDKAPFIHQDGKTMYFASTGRSDSEGGFDIYFSILDSLGWSKPKNLGQAINTPGDEHGMLVSTDGKYAVFATNTENMGQYDLFYLELPANSRPEAVVFLKGTVENATNETHLQLRNEKGELVREIELDKEDGSYTSILRKTEIKNPLVLGIQQQNVVFEARMIDTTRITNGMITNEKMKVNELSADKPYTIHDINFETNSAVLLNPSLSVLNEFARFLMLNPDYRVGILGHTDNVGGSEDNQILSVNRALAVKDYLITKGVPPGRLTHKGFGDTKPLDTNSTEVGKARNRRTEFVLSR